MVEASGAKGHDPVDGRKGHHEHIKNDAGAGEHFQAEAQGAVFAVDVLLLRQNIEDKHQQQPNRKINGRSRVVTK